MIDAALCIAVAPEMPCSNSGLPLLKLSTVGIYSQFLFQEVLSNVLRR